MNLASTFKCAGIALAVLLASTAYAQSSQAKPTTQLKILPIQSVTQLRDTINSLKVSEQTCDLDYIEMLLETVGSYVDHHELSEKEGVSLLVKMSLHTNACKKSKC